MPPGRTFPYGIIVYLTSCSVSLAPSVHPKALHIGDLHFSNLEFLSADKFQVHAAALTQGQQVLDFKRSAALAAARTARRPDNFELRACDWSILGADVEAKPDRVADHARKRADFEHNARHLGVANALADLRHHTFGYRKFVHGFALLHPAASFGRPLLQPLHDDCRAGRDQPLDLL